MRYQKRISAVYVVGKGWPAERVGLDDVTEACLFGDHNECEVTDEPWWESWACGCVCHSDPRGDEADDER